MMIRRRTEDKDIMRAYSVYIPAESTIPNSMPTPMEHRDTIRRILGKKRLSLDNIDYFDPHTDTLVESHLIKHEKEATMSDYHLLLTKCAIQEDLRILHCEYDELEDLIRQYDGMEDDHV